jgi:hypothetical protein
MDVDIRDSASLKPAELDELSQVLRKAGSPLPDSTIDDQVERFSRVTMVLAEDEEIHAFLFGSLERIGGTPCVLWGLGATDATNGDAGPMLEAMTTELYRRAAISFPDEDVLVAGRIANPALYRLFGGLQEPCPRPGYRASGEDRAWGRRLAKRFGCDARYDDRSFRLSGHGAPELVLHAAAVKGGGKVVVELVGETDPSNGEALIAYGWAMAEALADGLATPRS